jgi:putative transposase
VKKILEANYRVETHFITPGTPEWCECDDICWKAKNLYNQANYRIRQKFIHEGERIHYPTLQKELQNEHADCYIGLPAKVSQSLLKRLNDDWTGFFRASAEYKKFPAKFLGRPCLPGYLDKKSGRAAVTFSSQAYSQKELKNGYLKLSSLDFLLNLKTKAEEVDVEYVDSVTGEVIPEKVPNIRDVTIAPKDFGYEVIVKYIAKRVEPVAPGFLAGCDIGVNNLAAVVTNNKAAKPFLINGKPLKAMNTFYNKRLAELQAEKVACASKRGKKRLQREIEKLGKNRRHKIRDFLHKAARILVQQLQEAGVSHLVIGKNLEWKQNLDLKSSKATQNFAYIPHARFIEILVDKCRQAGISVETHEESYTSKCSFLDNEHIGRHLGYQGVRIRRGLFQTAKGLKLNADINGAANILKKAISNAWDLWSQADLIQGFVVSPRRLNVPQPKKLQREPIESL